VNRLTIGARAIIVPVLRCDLISRQRGLNLVKAYVLEQFFVFEVMSTSYSAIGFSDRSIVNGVIAESKLESPQVGKVTDLDIPSQNRSRRRIIKIEV
jgi:hypothetical protein